MADERPDLTEEIQRLKLNLEALKLSLETDQTLTELAFAQACCELEKRSFQSATEWANELRNRAVLAAMEVIDEKIPPLVEWHEKECSQ
jgi:hypothetical protein